MKPRYCVIGDPVEHSLAPYIYREFAVQTAIDLEYDQLPSTFERFYKDLSEFMANGGQGANVTLPFKQQAFDFIDQVSPQAYQAGAINTIKKITDDRFYGHNTDGPGLVQDLTHNLGWPIDAKHILILGAGGAARGIMPDILAEGPASVTIANRDLDKARTLAESQDDTPPVSAMPLTTDLWRFSWDIVLNATAASLFGKLPLDFNGADLARSYCYDLVYAKEDTVFIQAASNAGCRHYADGWGMLVEQAAKSFELWQGIFPVTSKALSSKSEMLT